MPTIRAPARGRADTAERRLGYRIKVPTRRRGVGYRIKMPTRRKGVGYRIKISRYGGSAIWLMAYTGVRAEFTVFTTWRYE